MNQKKKIMLPTLPTSLTASLIEKLPPLESLNEEQLAIEYAALRKILAEDRPITLLEDGFLFIKTKQGALVRLIPNKGQRKIIDIVIKLWEENKPIRLIVLKARQLGSTTLFMAIIYAIVSQSKGQSASIIADEKGKANGIFEMAKLMQEQLEEYLRPQIKASNERKLEFAGIHSQIAIDTAENKDAGRSSTLRYVLLSEYAYYRKDNADALMLGISHSVPNLGRTMIVKETTANGFNHFKDEWDDAVDGKNDYIPIFIPWYWGEDYKMTPQENFKVGDMGWDEIAKEEPELFKMMTDEGITDIEARLQWRRWDIRNNCKGSVDKFKQENPSTPEDAFLASGQCYFYQKELVRQLNGVKPPLFKCNIVKDNFKWVARKCDDGMFWFYKVPDKYGQYCVGGDAASGSGADFSTLIALDKNTNETVCVYKAKCDPDELAYRSMCLGFYLNTCLVGIETDKFGFAANEKLKTIYGNIYVQRTHDKITNKVVEKFGWSTTSITRPMMLSQMQAEIREGSTYLYDARLIRECLVFIKNPQSGKAEAEPGKNDDCVIARAIAGVLRKENPYILAPDKPPSYEYKDSKNMGMKFGKKKT